MKGEAPALTVLAPPRKDVGERLPVSIADGEGDVAALGPAARPITAAESGATASTRAHEFAAGLQPTNESAVESGLCIEFKTRSVIELKLIYEGCQ